MAANIAFNAGTGVLTILGSDGHDTAKVRIDSGSPLDQGSDQVIVTLTTDGQTRTQSFDLHKYKRGDVDFYERNVKLIVFEGGDGDDSFDNPTFLPCRAEGGNGADTLWGGSGDDTLLGGSGSDTLGGRVGDDHLIGGFGKDSLYGHDGDDYLNGNHVGQFPIGVTYDWVADELYGGPGADTYWAEHTFTYTGGGAWGIWWNRDASTDFSLAAGDRYI
jgi:Ca2+-binding RTX toxin-like protein